MKRWLSLLGATAVVIMVGAGVRLFLPAQKAVETLPIEQSDLPTPTNVIEVEPDTDIVEESSVWSNEGQSVDDYYHLARMGSMVALFDEEGAIIEVYEIYVHLLPPEDAQALNEGIKIESEQQLRQLLEDFGG